ncbi:MAG: ABC transporter ATP-binding protein [Phycisphaerales bacterium]|nr:ABC transporter ATP-binding protein [Phycisphaerales bacterium]
MTILEPESRVIDATPATAPAVIAEDVCKRYKQGSRNVAALKGLTLRITAGEFVAIMGASGSGKSTFLHLCAALDKPDSGRLCVAGRDIGRLGERDATTFRRRGVGIVFQQFNLIPTLSVKDNIMLPVRLAGDDEGPAWLRMRELVERLRLSHRVEHRPDALSGGEQQRVAIARALVMRPPLLLADEPTGNLDSVNAGQFWQALRDTLSAMETTVVLVTHEPLAALQSRRVVVLRDGCVAGEFNVEKNDDASSLAARYQSLAV